MNEIDDRCQLLLGIAGVLVRLKASSGRETIGQNTSYPNSKEEEKAILDGQIQIHERVG